MYQSRNEILLTLIHNNKAVLEILTCLCYFLFTRWQHLAKQLKKAPL